MFRITTRNGRLCDGIRRREVLRIGAASLLGLTLPGLLRAATGTRSGVRSCILFFLEGGPAHQDLWDMKPDAPLGVRSEFKPIATTVPGLAFCEHLPMLARQAHHLTLVRSVHHTIGDHNAGAYYAMTARTPAAAGRLLRAPAPDNFPPIGAVLAKLRPTGRNLRNFVQM